MCNTNDVGRQIWVRAGDLFFDRDADVEVVINHRHFVFRQMNIQFDHVGSLWFILISYIASNISHEKKFNYWTYVFGRIVERGDRVFKHIFDSVVKER